LGAIKDGHRAAIGLDRDIRELALAFGLLEDRHADQPNAHDPCRHLPADAVRVVRIEVAFLGQPFAKIVEPAAHDDMGLAMGPGRDRAAERRLGRQLATPEISDVLPVIELNRDAQIIVGGEGVLRDLRR